MMVHVIEASPFSRTDIKTSMHLFLTQPNFMYNPLLLFLVLDLLVSYFEAPVISLLKFTFRTFCFVQDFLLETFSIV
jgi:hypothetical protein